MDPALMYQAVAEGEVDVISAFSTDGRIAAYDIALLVDDLGVIPPYDAIVRGSHGRRVSAASTRKRREHQEKGPASTLRWPHLFFPGWP